MTIEPSQAYTVCRRPHLPPKDTRTVEERDAAYQASIVARLGEMPTWAELAKREATARTHRSEGRHVPFSDGGRAAIQSARRKVGEATENQIAEALQGIEATTQDLATALGRAENVVRRALLRMLDQGRVTKISVKRVAIWALA